MTLKLVFCVCLAAVLAGCAAWRGEGEQQAQSCRAAISAAGVPLEVCQEGGQLRVFTARDGAVSEAEVAAAVSELVDYSAIPVARSPAIALTGQRIENCVMSNAPDAAGRTIVQCAVVLELAPGFSEPNLPPAPALSLSALRHLPALRPIEAERGG